MLILGEALKIAFTEQSPPELFGVEGESVVENTSERKYWQRLNTFRDGLSTWFP